MIAVLPTLEFSNMHITNYKFEMLLKFKGKKIFYFGPMPPPPFSLKFASKIFPNWALTILPALTGDDFTRG